MGEMILLAISTVLFLASATSIGSTKFPDKFGRIAGSLSWGSILVTYFFNIPAFAVIATFFSILCIFGYAMMTLGKTPQEMTMRTFIAILDVVQKLATLYFVILGQYNQALIEIAILYGVTIFIGILQGLLESMKVKK